MTKAKPEWHFLGHEMNGVPAFGKPDSEFGGEDAAAAGGWMTGDTDIHDTFSSPGGSPTLTVPCA